MDYTLEDLTKAISMVKNVGKKSTLSPLQKRMMSSKEIK